ncbi:MAG: 5-methylcytosine-specific restriction endonuclease system specificity protein McrC [Bradymonadaceae bacterium]
MNIPVANIYYLLLYAWDKLDVAPPVAAGVEDETELADLFARLLIHGTRKLVRRGLDRSYSVRSEEVSSLRGQIDFIGSIDRMAFQRGRAVCRFDELTTDVTHNRILKATLRVLAKVKGLKSDHSHSLQHLYQRMPEVRDIMVRADTFREVQLHHNNRFYGYLLDICRVVLEQLIVNEEDGSVVFGDFRRDERAMAYVFERFVFNFYRIEQSEFEVTRETINWDVEYLYGGGQTALPVMNTDTSLRSKHRTLILDTKYYQNTLQGRHTVHSANIYQLFAYLKNLEARGGADARATGILLYPQVDRPVSMRCRIPGHEVLVKTVDLTQPWRGIHEALLELVKDGVDSPPVVSLVPV